MIEGKVKAIFFDLDGTLIDSAQDLTTSVNLTLENYGFKPITFEQCINFVGDGTTQLVSRSLGMSAHDDPNFDWNNEFLVESVNRFLSIYTEHLVDRTHLYPGVAKTLKKIEGINLAVISNKSYDLSVEILSRLKIIDRFDLVLGGDSLEEKKPSAEPLRYALRQFGIDPQLALMVGDGSNDIFAGRSANTKTCGVTYGFRSPEIIRSLQPDYQIDRFEDILNLPCIQ